MLAKPSQASKPSVSKSFLRQTDLKPRPQQFRGLFIETADSNEVQEVHPFPPPQRPMTSKATRQPYSSRTSIQSILSSPRKPQQYVKGVPSPKDVNPMIEKVPVPVGVYPFKSFLPAASPNNNSSPRLSLIANQKKITGSSSHRASELNEGQSYNPFFHEPVMLERVGNTYPGVKKGITFDMSTPLMKKVTSPENEKFEDFQSSVIKISENEVISPNTAGMKKYGIGLVSPRSQAGRYGRFQTQLYKASSQPKPNVKEVENVSTVVAQEQEDNVIIPEKIVQGRDRDAIKFKEVPVSQAMFRMKEFRRAKDVILQRKKIGMTITTIANESSVKCITPQAVSKVRFFGGDSPSGRDARNKVMEKETRDEEAMTDEVPMGIRRSISNNADMVMKKSIEFTDKKEQRTLEDDIVKSWNVKKKAQDERRRDTQGKQDHSSGYPKVEKFDMKMFMKTVGIADAQNFKPHAPPPKIVVEEKLPPVEELKKSPRQQIEKLLDKSEPAQILKSTEDKSKNTMTGSSVSLSEKTKRPSKSPRRIKSPPDSPKTKQAGKLKKIIDKGNSKPENMILRKKKNSQGSLVEIEELSKISIKQFEVSESWEYDGFELMKPV